MRLSQKKVGWCAMVMDDMFSHFAGLPELPLEAAPGFGIESDMPHTKVDLIPDLPIDLEELEFDFEEMNDFGPWIETDVKDIAIDSEPCKPESDRLNFKDLEIQEAVRYDCMWSSYSEFSSDKVNADNSSDSLTLSNSFYDSLLQSFDTPASRCSSDSSSVKSEMETDEDIDVSSEKESEKEKEVGSCLSDQLENISRQTSLTNWHHHSSQLDHCYNISSSHLDNQPGPLTPPVSSDDEESNNTFSYSNINKNKNKHCTTIKTKHQTNTKVQSLLKKPNQRISSEAKFSFKVNLKADNKSRSLLKQKIQKVKIIKAPFKKERSCGLSVKLGEAGRVRLGHSGVRKRKERTLKMQEGEAREVHNQMERQRRNELKVSFDTLKTVLPDIAGSEKASKQQILDKAVETVKTIKSAELSLHNRRNSLTKSNALLKQKLRQLKEQVRRQSSELDIEDGAW